MGREAPSVIVCEVFVRVQASGELIVANGGIVAFSDRLVVGFRREILNLFFEGAKTFDCVRQLLEADPLALHFSVGLRRNAEDGFAVGDVAHDAGFGSDGGLAAEFEVARDAGLGGDDAIVGELCAAGKSNLAHDEAMVAYDHVMRDMDEVVDFGALADDCGAEGRAIDGGIGADLDVVANDDVADLKNFAVAAFVENVAVAVGADDGSGVDDDAVADLATVINNDVGEEACVSADLGVATDVIAAH